jgi:hypothetical protein
MMNRFLSIIMLLLITITGCQATMGVDYDLAKSITYDSWEQIVGPLSSECIAHAESFRIKEVKHRAIKCGNYNGPGMVFGCIHHTERLIEIREILSSEAKMKTMIHEIIHALGRCMNIEGSGSSHENGLLWYRPGTGIESVEGLGYYYLAQSVN